MELDRVNRAEPATARVDSKTTEVGSVFVSNYPPYSAWSAASVAAAVETLESPADPQVHLGLYLHIPFCRRRCKFCYFKVYTDKNSQQIAAYTDALAREVELYSQLPAIAGRPLHFVYFGGGTPSYISIRHLHALVRRIKAVLPWDGAREVTFECEPGTLTKSKLEAIREIGVTRLSLGVEHFDDEILRENGRAHTSKEIFRVMPWIRDLAFDQLNIDLITGMVGETRETWYEAVARTIDLGPDSVTIYQMELPYNTLFSERLQAGGLGRPLADWETKREWHGYAFDRLAEACYEISSAYTMVRKNKNCRFVYRDALWRGSDMVGTGVASFSQVGGIHFQNVAAWDGYLGAVGEGRLPLSRALVASARERLTREVILQLKRGELDAAYFRGKFGVDILEVFREPLAQLAGEGMLALEEPGVRLTRQGLLQVDGLLPEFYEQHYRNARYT
jgi:oxygen-independent coproporphyrinogen-3 oxidase